MFFRCVSPLTGLITLDALDNRMLGFLARGQGAARSRLFHVRAVAKQKGSPKAPCFVRREVVQAHTQLVLLASQLCVLVIGRDRYLGGHALLHMAKHTVALRALSRLTYKATHTVMREAGVKAMRELALEAPARVQPGVEAPLAPGLNGFRNWESPPPINQKNIIYIIANVILSLL